MALAKDIIGEKFGNLTVVGRDENRDGKAIWICKCICGKIITKPTYSLKNKPDISCGCCNRHGVPTKTLTKDVLRKVFFIDENGHMISYKRNTQPTLDTNGYYLININGEQIYEHRLVWMYYNGTFPSGVIDHIDQNKHNNKIENLRDVGCSINSKNSKRSSSNTSGVTGVYWDKNRSKWIAAIKVNYRTKHLGRFDDFDEAVKARKDAEGMFGFHKNHGK